MSKHPKTVADLMDEILLEGPIEWELGAKIADKYRSDLGYKKAITRGVFREHARYRMRTRGWGLKMDDVCRHLIRTE